MKNCTYYLNLHIFIITILAALNSNQLNAQSFNLRVKYYQQSCIKKIEYCEGESVLSWSLSSSKAILYYGTNNNPVEVYTVTEVENDQINDRYLYTFFDSKRNKYGIIGYFRASKAISLQYVNQSCTLDYALY